MSVTDYRPGLSQLRHASHTTTPGQPCLSHPFCLLSSMIRFNTNRLPVLTPWLSGGWQPLLLGAAAGGHRAADREEQAGGECSGHRLARLAEVGNSLASGRLSCSMTGIVQLSKQEVSDGERGWPEVGRRLAGGWREGSMTGRTADRSGGED